MKTEVIEKLAALITAAFGLIAALAWNSAIQSIFNKYYTAGEGISSMVWYAIIVTVIAITATIWIGKVAERSKTKLVKK
jgi:hypothetical protein